MDNNEKCEIVRDLATQYIEKSISERSKKFVRNHLQECENCKKYYNTLESKIGNGDEQDKIILKQLKKVHKHISILKTTLISILILVLIAGIVLWTKQKIFSNVVNKVSEKLEYLETLDNYKITIRTIHNNFNTQDYNEFYEEYYYKGGKLKRESRNSISFYKDDSYDSIYIYNDLKQIEYHHSNYIMKKKGSAIGPLSYIKDNYKGIESTIFSLAYTVREDRFNGIECYVIRIGNNNSYSDIWVDKNSFITVREVNEEYASFYSERVFTFEENIVTDEDVDSSILDNEKYDDYKRIEVNTKFPKEQIEIFDSLYTE